MVANNSTQALPQAPDSFTHFAGQQIPYGLFNGAVNNVGTLPWQNLRRNARKTWIYAGVFSQRYYTGFAIADAGLVATAFAYVFDAYTKKYVEEKITVPFGFAAGFDPDMKSEWTLKNFAINPQGNKLLLTYQGKRLNLTVELHNNTAHGLTTIAPAATRPFNHTYKDILMPALVNATVDGEAITYSGNIGSIDFSKGYPPRQTFWNWASMVGQTENGQAVGLNLVAQHNNSFENALWVDNTAQGLSQAIFEYQQPLDTNTWAIRSLDGMANLTFTPLGKRAENINALFMVSKFVQPFGVFNGTIYINGSHQKVTGYGVVEEHFAKW